MQRPLTELGQAPVYRTIEALRGVAAMMVVAFHCWFAVQEHLGGGGPSILRQGNTGVDIFFVISGFVMVVSSQSLMRQVGGWKTFLLRRIVRIVPLYWLMTTIMLALLVAVPSLNHHAPPDLQRIVASYLFIPAHDAAGQLRPVVADGWTLSFEMLFYLLFTAALFFRIGIFRLTVPVFAVLALVALVRRDDWPGWTFLASELPIEFLFGALVGAMTLRGRILARPPALAGLAIAVAALMLLPPGPVIGNTTGVGSVTLRVLTYGLPAMLGVAALVALEVPARALLPRWLLALGDASYSIYLSHGFVLAALTAVATRHGGGHPAAFIAVGMVASATTGLLLYRIVERPMQRVMKRWVLTDAPVATSLQPSAS